jgi:hypothetical protein
MSTAEALCQTTLTQCFSPPVAAAPASSLSNRKILIDGKNFLINDAAKDHLMAMLATGIREQRVVSEKAQSLSLINLAQDSYNEEVAPSITPSVRKGAKRPPSTTHSNVVLSENNGSDEEIVYVTRHRKKKKLVPFLPALQLSDKVQVIEQVTLNLEVNSQDSPKTGQFGVYAAADKTASI